jgi:hypothetical protein
VAALEEGVLVIIRLRGHKVLTDLVVVEEVAVIQPPALAEVMEWLSLDTLLIHLLSNRTLI